MDSVGRIKELLSEERQFSNKQKQDRVAKQQKDKLKEVNKDRAKQGLEPIYAKTNEVKNMHLHDKFAQLDKSGKLD